MFTFGPDVGAGCGVLGERALWAGRGGDVNGGRWPRSAWRESPGCWWERRLWLVATSCVSGRGVRGGDQLVGGLSSALASFGREPVGGAFVLGLAGGVGVV